MQQRNDHSTTNCITLLFFSRKNFSICPNLQINRWPLNNTPAPNQPPRLILTKDNKLLGLRSSYLLQDDRASWCLVCTQMMRFWLSHFGHVRYCRGTCPRWHPLANDPVRSLVNNKDQITHDKIAAWQVPFLSSLQCGQVVHQPFFRKALCLTPAFSVHVLLFEYVKWKVSVRLTEPQFVER